jgi:hypothetical protein
MPSILKTGEDQYQVQTRGTSMTLSRYKNGWAVVTHNAATRAWNRGIGSHKEFASLAEVEQHYKSWRGIEALACSEASSNVVH